MGGKSTLLRQTCLVAILAQIGCYVPATECTISIVDRVFTRIGASDRILENKSTFFVELEETKAICELTTPDSLVIMDELGRGTSTFDGYSIAHSVLTYLSCKVQCRTLFTTHYHMLVDDFRNQKNIGLFMMGCEIEEDKKNNGHIGKVGFQYKFQPGEAKTSFGLYVAKMAGVNEKVLKIAQQKSDQFSDKLSSLVVKVASMKI